MPTAVKRPEKGASPADTGRSFFEAAPAVVQKQESTAPPAVPTPPPVAPPAPPPAPPPGGTGATPPAECGPPPAEADLFGAGRQAEQPWLQPGPTRGTRQRQPLTPLPALHLTLEKGSSDPAEKEADTLAENIIRQPSAGNTASFFAPAARPGMGAGAPAPLQAAQVARATSATGEELAPAVRHWFESRFGTDLSGVHIHRDGAAAEAAESLGAKAFTTGEHIVFGAGQYQPGSPAGRRLLAHELIHVLQQRHGATTVQRKPGDAGPVVPETTSVKLGDNIAKLKRAFGKTADGASPLTHVLVRGTSKAEFYRLGETTERIATYEVHPRTLLPHFYILTPDLTFGVLTVQYVEGENKKKQPYYNILGFKKATEAEKKAYELFDQDLDIPTWFTKEEDRKDFSEKIKSAGGFAIIVPPFNIEEGKGEVPPMPAWMDGYQTRMRQLIDATKTKEPSSADLPDKFYLYYSSQFARWRARAEQASDDPKKPLQEFLDIAEKDDQQVRLRQIRDKIRIQQLDTGEAARNSKANSLPPELEWAFLLKLETERLIQQERLAYPSSAELPDRIGVITLDEDGVRQPYLRLWLYTTEAGEEGKTVSDLKTGRLASPLTPETKAADLFAVVKKATLLMRGRPAQQEKTRTGPPRHILAPFPATIRSTTIRSDFRTVTDGKLEMTMDLNLSAIDGENELSLASIIYRGYYFTWDVYRVSDLIGEEEYTALPEEWEARRPALESWFQYKRSDILQGRNPALSTEGGLQLGNKEILDGEGLRRFRNKGWSLGAATSMSPDATIPMPQATGEYVIFGQALPEPGETIFRLPSQAFYPVKVVDGYRMAAEYRDQRSREIAEKSDRLAAMPQESSLERNRLEEELEGLRRLEQQNFNARTADQLANHRATTAMLKRLRGYYQNFPTQEITNRIYKDPDRDAMIEVWSGLETQSRGATPESVLDTMIAKSEQTVSGYLKLGERIRSFGSDTAGYTFLPAPEVGLVSKVTGEAYPLLLSVGIRTERTGGVTRTSAILLDMTTYETQGKYFGESSEGDADRQQAAAIKAAFEAFGRNCKYGEGYLSYRIPVLELYGNVESAPGVAKRVKAILANVAAVVGILSIAAGTFATGGLLAFAIAAGTGASIVGAALAADNIIDRASNHRLEADVELAGDVLNLTGPLLQGLAKLGKMAKLANTRRIVRANELFQGVTDKAEDLAKATKSLRRVVLLERSVVIIQKVSAVSNIILVGVKTAMDLKAAEEMYANYPERLFTLRAEIIKNAILQGTLALVSAYGEFKPKKLDKLDDLVNSLQKVKGYDKAMQGAGLKDAEGNWLDPKMKEYFTQDPDAVLTAQDRAAAKQKEQEERRQRREDEAEARKKEKERRDAERQDREELRQAMKEEELAQRRDAAEHAANEKTPKRKAEKQQERDEYEKAMKEEAEAMRTEERKQADKQRTEKKEAAERKKAVRKRALSIKKSKEAAARKREAEAEAQRLREEADLRKKQEEEAARNAEALKKKQEEAEAARRQEEAQKAEEERRLQEEKRKAEERRRQEEEEAERRRQEEEAERRRQEDARRKAEEQEAERKAREEEAARRKAAEAEEAARRQRAEDEARKKAEADKAEADKAEADGPAKPKGPVLNPRVRKVLNDLDEAITVVEGQKALGDPRADKLLSRLRGNKEALLGSPDEKHVVKALSEGLLRAKLTYPKNYLDAPDIDAYVRSIPPGRKFTTDLARNMMLKADTWQELITALKQHGRGHLIEPMKQFRMEQLALFSKEKMRVSLIGDASVYDDSDVDVQFSGAHAGADVIRAEKLMEANFGPHWSKHFRMNMYTEGSRLTFHEQVRGLQSAGEQLAFDKMITTTTARLAFAKMLHHAKGNPAREAAVRRMIDTTMPELRPEAEQLAAGYDAPTERRNKLLLEVDQLQLEYHALPAADTAARVKKAQAITLRQMETNFYTEEANLGPASLSMGKTDLSPQLSLMQRIFTNLEMMEHIIHQSGSVGAAGRRYEMHKYINRLHKDYQHQQFDLFFDYLTRRIYQGNRADAATLSEGEAAGLYNDFVDYNLETIRNSLASLRD